jgi:hypothetical protein
MKRYITPTDTNQLRKDCCLFHKELQEVRVVNNELRKRIIQTEKALRLADGLLMELDAKRLEPGLLESIKTRLRIELSVIDASKIITVGVKRERSAGGGVAS